MDRLFGAIMKKRYICIATLSIITVLMNSTCDKTGTSSNKSDKPQRVAEQAFDSTSLIGSWELDSMLVYYSFRRDTSYSMILNRAPFNMYREVMHIDSNLFARRVELQTNLLFYGDTSRAKYYTTGLDSGKLVLSNTEINGSGLIHGQFDGRVLVAHGTKYYSGFMPMTDSMIRYFSPIKTSKLDSIRLWMKQPLIVFD